MLRVSRVGLLLVVALMFGVLLPLLRRQDFPIRGSDAPPQRTAVSEPALAPHSTVFSRPAMAPGTAMSKPWTDNLTAFEARRYSMLIEQARLAPERGSYYYAVKALLKCAALTSQAPRVLANIDKVSRAEQKATRLRAWQELTAGCVGVKDDAALASRLAEEGEKAGDVLLTMEKRSRLLGDLRLAREERTKIMRQLMETRDFESTMAASAAYSVDGATFRGERIGESEKPAFPMAYYLAACTFYGRSCLGPDATQSHEWCATLGLCEYYDPLTDAQAALPPHIHTRMRDFYSGIYSSFLEGRAEAFGVP